MRRLFIVILCFAAAPAWPQEDARLKFLIKRLEKAKDARGRAQAALILGASSEPGAVPPLCGALSDPDPIVQSAAAKALQELGELSALDCLKKAQGGAHADAKAALKDSIGALQQRRDRKPSLYVSLEPIVDERAHADSATARLAEENLKRHLERSGALLAPRGESAAAAQKVLKTRKLAGYHLIAKLKTAGGGTQLVLLGSTYPGKALRGQVAVTASGADAAALIKALVPAALKEAADTFEWKVQP